MSEEEVFCDICGESHKLKFVHTLQCNHSYHYECIQKSFLYWNLSFQKIDLL